MLRDNSRQKSKIPKNAISSLAKYLSAFIFLSHWPPLILPSPSLSIGHSCKWRAAGKHDGYRCNLWKCCYFESRHTHTKVIYKWKYRRNSQPRQQTTKVLLAPPTQPPPHPASSILPRQSSTRSELKFIVFGISYSLVFNYRLLARLGCCRLLFAMRTNRKQSKVNFSYIQFAFWFRWVEELEVTRPTF